MRLSSRTRNGLLTVHLVTAVGALGADLVLLTLGLSGLLGADPITIYPAAALIGSAIVVPLAVVALASGVLLGLLTSWGLFRYWWTAMKLTIAAALIVAVVVVLAPRLGASADAAMAGRPFTAAERQALVIAPVVGTSLLAVNVGLAVFKPRWRLRRIPSEPSPSSQTQTENTIAR
jgi:hypothetical protein